MPDDAGALTAAHEVIRLWPDGPPSTIEGVGPEASFRGTGGTSVGTLMLRNVSDPSLTVFRPAAGKANGVGVIVVPGGGWRILAWEHEGVDLANWLAERGYTAFLLKYRVMGTPSDPAQFAKAMTATAVTQNWGDMPAAKAPRNIETLLGDGPGKHARNVAREDGQRALALVRERAGDFGVAPDRVGMIGFSAGAFLAADVAMQPAGPPLAFVAPIYGGQTNGEPIPADAPPLFTVIAQDDRMLFKVVEGLYADWSNADKPAELHIFRRGEHGFGMVNRGLPVDRWIDLFGHWLVDLGFA
jgi:acetyl esterase/lipase